MRQYMAYIILIMIMFRMYLNKSKVQYECGNCRHRFKISSLIYFFSLQRPRKRYLKCPQCVTWSWAASDDKEKGLFERFRW
jgi:DNA-directed RNA polymerase subunit RPC12/RpoP